MTDTMTEKSGVHANSKGKLRAEAMDDLNSLSMTDFQTKLGSSPDMLREMLAGQELCGVSVCAEIA
jgi:hypothetical protein